MPLYPAGSTSPDNKTPVNSSSDLPTASGGIITLVANTNYEIGADLSLSDRLVFGDNTLLTGNNSNSPTLTYTGTGTFITGVDTNATLKDIKINCATGKVFDFSDTANTSIVILNTITIVSCVDFGDFDNLAVLEVVNSSSIGGTGLGAVFTGSDWILLTIDKFAIASTSATFKGIDLGSSTFTTLELNNLIPIPIHASGFGLSGLASGGNLIGSNVGMVAGGNFNATGTPLENISKTDPAWFFTNNTAIEDSHLLGFCKQVGNTVSTTLTTSSYVALADGFIAGTDIERFTVGSSTGTHDGAADAAVLTDTTQSWGVNALVGKTISNTTDGSHTTITANTATTITGVLTGGTDNDWDIGDAYTTNDLVASVLGSGVATISVDGSKDGGGATANLDFALFKNGSQVGDIVRNVTIGTDPASITFRTSVTFVVADEFDIRISRLSGTSDWITKNGTLDIQ